MILGILLSGAAIGGFSYLVHKENEREEAEKKHKEEIKERRHRERLRAYREAHGLDPDKI